MQYRHAPAANHADLDAVLASAPGRPALPVRLTLELFGRCREHLGDPGPVVVWDPCCGTGQLLATLGLLRGDQVAGLVGSDADPDPLDLAARNLALLRPGGPAGRAEEFDALARRHGKPGYREAAAAARRLGTERSASGTSTDTERSASGASTDTEPSASGASTDTERSASGASTDTERSAGGASTDTERSAGGASTDTARSSTARSVPVEVCPADAFDPVATAAIVARHRPQIVLTDAPYGTQTAWAGSPQSDQGAEAELITALVGVLDPGAVIALVARARRVPLPPGVHALERLRSGHRAAVLVRAGN